MTLIRLLAPLALFGLISPLGAQSPDRGPIILELPASTRALALGNTFALGFRDSNALFYQPGLLDRAQGQSVSIQRFSSAATLAALSTARGWFGGGVALGVQYLAYQTGSYDFPPEVELLSFPTGEPPLRSGGGESISELVISGGYGRQLLGLRIGVVGKLLEQRYRSIRSTTGAFDVGVAASPGPLTVGFAAQNLGWDMPAEEDDIPLPTRFILGASTRTAPVGPLDLSLSSALGYRLDGDLIPSVGLEVGYWPVSGRTFVGRIGYRHLSGDEVAGPLNLGGAVYLDSFILEYAFQGYDSGDPVHRFGIGWR